MIFLNTSLLTKVTIEMKSRSRRSNILVARVAIFHSVYCTFSFILEKFHRGLYRKLTDPLREQYVLFSFYFYSTVIVFDSCIQWNVLHNPVHAGRIFTA